MVATNKVRPIIINRLGPFFSLPPRTPPPKRRGPQAASFHPLFSFDPPVGGSLHPRLLLLAGTRAAVFRAGFVELPREVEGEGAAGWVVDCQIAIAVDDGIGLVGIEDVDAAQVGSQ